VICTAMFAVFSFSRGSSWSTVYCW